MNFSRTTTELSKKEINDMLQGETIAIILTTQDIIRRSREIGKVVSDDTAADILSTITTNFNLVEGLSYKLIDRLINESKVNTNELQYADIHLVSTNLNYNLNIEQVMELVIKYNDFSMQEIYADESWTYIVECLLEEEHPKCT